MELEEEDKRWTEAKEEKLMRLRKPELFPPPAWTDSETDSKKEVGEQFRFATLDAYAFRVKLREMGSKRTRYALLTTSLTIYATCTANR